MPSFSKLLSVALVTLAATSSVSGSGLRVRDDCPRGQEWNGRECVHQPSADDCSRGQEWNGRECVDKKVEPSADSCGRDQEWNGRACVDKKVECGRDQQLNRAGDGCEDIPKPDVDTRVPDRTPAEPAGPTDEEVAEAARVLAMKKHTDKVACNKKCKSDHAKPVCAKGKAGKDCRKDKSWKDKKATCLAGCKA